MSRATVPHAALEPPRLSGAFHPRALMDLLLSVAGPRLAASDLAAIVKGGASYVESMAEHAACVAEGVGCLVADDARQAPVGCGNFQDGESVSVLMWHMQSHLEAIAGVSAAVSWAVAELAERQASVERSPAAAMEGGAA